MFKFKFKDIEFYSNRKFNNQLKKLIILPGLGCSALDYSFLLRRFSKKYQIFIFEIPNYNISFNKKYEKDYLIEFAKKIYLFLKFKRITKFSIYSHSMSGIVLILLFRFFFKEKNKLLKIVNNEGNLISSDTSLLTKKTISYDLNFFKETGYNNLKKKCVTSNDLSVKKWSLNLQNISALDFYKYSYYSYKWSMRSFLLSFYKNFFKKKIYIYGEKSKNLELLRKMIGEKKICIKNGGHFSYIDNQNEFMKILSNFLLEK